MADMLQMTFSNTLQKDLSVFWSRCHRSLFLRVLLMATQTAKFMGPTWGPSGSCRPQMGPMLAPWTLLSGYLVLFRVILTCSCGFASNSAMSLSASIIIVNLAYHYQSGIHVYDQAFMVYMMTSSNGNIFRVTDQFIAGNSSVPSEFPAQSPCDAELRCFLWSASE